jgi:plastocyanin
MYRLLIAISLIGVFFAALACTAGASTPATQQPSVDPNALSISARNIAFSTDTLSAPAGRPFQIVFDNQESAPHNVAIYRDLAARDSVFVGEVFPGPRVVVYEVPALEPGTYQFICDVHPSMEGILTVR